MTLLNLLLHANQLKRTPRTGWVQRGVPSAENVAAHSYGVTFTALTLALTISEPLNLEKVMIMALLHDLPEALTTDIPTPAWRFLPAGIKTSVERQAMEEILEHPPTRPQLLALWEELHASETAEAKLVHDADKLEMFLQAWQYQHQTGNIQLEEFWDFIPRWHFPQSAELFAEILRMKEGKPL